MNTIIPVPLTLTNPWRAGDPVGRPEGCPTWEIPPDTHLLARWICDDSDHRRGLPVPTMGKTVLNSKKFLVFRQRLPGRLCLRVPRQEVQS